MIPKKCLLIATILILSSLFASAQNDTSDLLRSLSQQPAQRDYVYAAFKSTRVINAHSLEMAGKGSLDFRILHRFGLVSNGINQFFGLDQASMRLGFDYGISRNIMVGVGRSTFHKEIDGFIKARLVQQSTGLKSFPLSVLVIAGTMVRTEKAFTDPKPSFSERTAHYLQLIAGRKFNSKFSLQLSPVFLYTNTPYNMEGDKVLFAGGLGARYKVSKRVAITADYHHSLNSMDSVFTSPLSLGIDIETGGHVFQLHFSNATGMNERAYLTETAGRFFEGDIRFGFNLSRVFQIRKQR